MLNDTLERERLVDNLIDRVFDLEERLRRLEELMLRPGEFQVIVPHVGRDTRWQLRVIDFGDGDERGPMLEMSEL